MFNPIYSKSSHLNKFYYPVNIFYSQACKPRDYQQLERQTISYQIHIAYPLNLFINLSIRLRYWIKFFNPRNWNVMAKKAHKLELEFEEEGSEEPKEKELDEIDEVDLEFNANSDQQTNALVDTHDDELQKLVDDAQLTEQRSETTAEKMSKEERIKHFRNKKKIEKLQKEKKHKNPPRERSPKVEITPEEAPDSTDKTKLISEDIKDNRPSKPTSKTESVAPREPLEKRNLKLVEENPEVHNVISEIRVSIAETKGKIYGEHLSEAKLLEYKIQQICKKINKISSPEITKQLQIIIKILEEYIKKIKF